ncbi:MAG: single-stranded-DNA-specific exonuclease RecJ [Solirubrobacteraceae bacterium]
MSESLPKFGTEPVIAQRPPLRLVTGDEPLRLRPQTGTELPPRPIRPQPRLEIPAYDLAAARTLERELGVSRILAEILVRRRFSTGAAARALLEGAERHAADSFAGIGDVVAVIRRHVSSGARITVHGDYDVDGVCATAVMVRALRALGANVGWFIPSRLDEGYGLSSRTAERLAAKGTQLLLTVDCGITAIEEARLARAAGMDVVVTDHHAPAADGVLPECPILHPGVCGYPFRELCGTAVAFKLAQALGSPTAAEDVELVALASVADLMPLRGENRALVREGLAVMANTSKPGLQALLEVSRTDPSSLDAGAVGFRLAPRLNAAGRMRRADAALELLLTEDPGRARTVAMELDALNAERRAIEDRTTWEAEAKLAEVGERSAYVLWHEDWHRGVIGIVASRIVERYHRPTVLVALDGGLLGQGSGRSIPGFDLLGALNAVAEHLHRYGGHRAAAGLSVARSRLPALAEALECHASAVLTEDQLRPVERVDAIVSAADLGLGLAEELERLAPYGIGNPRPCLLVPGARFEDARSIGEGRHALFTTVSGGARAKAVSFGCGGRLPCRAGEPVDAAFALERNEWRGLVEPRLVLRHAQPCAPERVTLIGEPATYLEGVLAELDAPLHCQRSPTGSTCSRTVLDRRGHSPLVVLRDAVASGQGVLAVCAEVSRRLRGLEARAGGFVLASYHGLERQPEVARSFAHLVMLDPPACAAGVALAHGGSGYTHLAWGEAELRFAWQMHELEYALRASLATLYRGVRARGRVAGEELEQLLRTEGHNGRPARVAGRLVRVLAELQLVSLDRLAPALEMASEAPTELERSPAYRVYQQRYEDGQRFLSGEQPRPSG